MSSLGNFALSVAIAREGSLSELGRFAVAFSLYALVTGLARAAVSESLLSLLAEAAVVRSAARRVSAIGLLAAAPILVIGVVAHSGYLVVLGVVLPGMVLYDYVKIMSLGLGKPLHALLQETIWTTGTLAVVVWTLAAHPNPITPFFCWAALGAALGLGHARLLHFAATPGWAATRQETKVAITFGLDFLAGSGSAQLTLTAMALVTSTALVGALRGASTIVGPLGLLAASARSMLIPYLARSRSAAHRVRWRVALRMTGTLVLLVLPLCVVVAVLPDSLGRLALGQNWLAAKPLLPALVLEFLFGIASLVAFAGHRVERAGIRTLMVRTGIAPLRVAFVVGAASLFGAQGAATMMAATALLSAVVWWLSYRLLLQGSLLRESSSLGVLLPETETTSP